MHHSGPHHSGPENDLGGGGRGVQGGGGGGARGWCQNCEKCESGKILNNFGLHISEHMKKIQEGILQWKGGLLLQKFVQWQFFLQLQHKRDSEEQFLPRCVV